MVVASLAAADDTGWLLDELRVRAWMADLGRGRPMTKRSRVVLLRQVTYFRAAWPEVWPSLGPLVDASDTEASWIAPTPDWQFDIALMEAAGSPRPSARMNVRSMLLLCRGAGLNGGDLAHVRGVDIGWRRNAGYWVTVTAPGRERDVPILARFARPLADIAELRGDRSLLTSGRTHPVSRHQIWSVQRSLRRRLAGHGHGFSVGPESLRKAWLLEHLDSDVPMMTLLDAAGLQSVGSVERLLGLAERVPMSEQRIGVVLGAVAEGTADR